MQDDMYPLHADNDRHQQFYIELDICLLISIKPRCAYQKHNKKRNKDDHDLDSFINLLSHKSYFDIFAEFCERVDHST